MAIARENGGRLLKALTEEDSPALAQGIKLLRGAHQRVRARGHLFFVCWRVYLFGAGGCTFFVFEGVPPFALEGVPFFVLEGASFFVLEGVPFFVLGGVPFFLREGVPFFA